MATGVGARSTVQHFSFQILHRLEAHSGRLTHASPSHLETAGRTPPVGPAYQPRNVCYSVDHLAQAAGRRRFSGDGKQPRCQPTQLSAASGCPSRQLTTWHPAPIHSSVVFSAHPPAFHCLPACIASSRVDSSKKSPTEEVM